MTQSKLHCLNMSVPGAGVSTTGMCDDSLTIHLGHPSSMSGMHVSHT